MSNVLFYYTCHWQNTLLKSDTIKQTEEIILKIKKLQDLVQIKASDWKKGTCDTHLDKANPP